MIHIANYPKFRRAGDLWARSVLGSTEAERAVALRLFENCGAACAVFEVDGPSLSLGRTLRRMLLKSAAARLGFVVDPGWDRRLAHESAEEWRACGPPAAVLSLRAVYAAADLMLALALSDWRLPLDSPAGVAYLGGVLAGMLSDLSLPPGAMVPPLPPGAAAPSGCGAEGGDSQGAAGRAPAEAANEAPVRESAAESDAVAADAKPAKAEPAPRRGSAREAKTVDPPASEIALSLMRSAWESGIRRVRSLSLLGWPEARSARSSELARVRIRRCDS
jgi:hypothetical protein